MHVFLARAGENSSTTYSHVMQNLLLLEKFCLCYVCKSNVADINSPFLFMCKFIPQLEEANVYKETKQFTYKDGSQYVFMDLVWFKSLTYLCLKSS